MINIIRVINITLTPHDNYYITIIRQNASEKLLLKTITGKLISTSGSIIYNNIDIAHMDYLTR